jgi:LysR family transcriptional regulator, nitrogen assimilation regulatory protein
LDSRLLEYFLRIAELGSINKAAADLQLSQPALSRHLSALEHEMGTKLFNRTQGGVQLTDSGKLLADRARPLLRQFTILKEQVGEKAAGQLTIGIPPSWHNVFTLGWTTRVVAQYPGVSLRVYEGVSHVLSDYMFAGLLDLAIVPFDPESRSEYRQTPLVREQLVLVGNIKEGLERDDPVAVSRLDGVKLILPGRPNVLRALVEHSIARKGLSFKMGVETDNVGLCLDMARLGMGVTVVPACSLHGHPLAADMSWAPVKGLYITWSLSENPARMHSQAVREGRRMVLSSVAETLQKGEWFGATAVGPVVSKSLGN